MIALNVLVGLVAFGAIYYMLCMLGKAFSKITGFGDDGDTVFHPWHLMVAILPIVAICVMFLFGALAFMLGQAILSIAI